MKLLASKQVGRTRDKTPCRCGALSSQRSAPSVLGLEGPCTKNTAILVEGGWDDVIFSCSAFVYYHVLAWAAINTICSLGRCDDLSVHSLSDSGQLFVVCSALNHIFVSNRGSLEWVATFAF